jgi:hypothetical protein
MRIRMSRDIMVNRDHVEIFVNWSTFSEDFLKSLELGLSISGLANQGPTQAEL